MGTQKRVRGQAPARSSPPGQCQQRRSLGQAKHSLFFPLQWKVLGHLSLTKATYALQSEGHRLLQPTVIDPSRAGVIDSSTSPGGRPNLSCQSTSPTTHVLPTRPSPTWLVGILEVEPKPLPHAIPFTYPNPNPNPKP